MLQLCGGTCGKARFLNETKNKWVKARKPQIYHPYAMHTRKWTSPAGQLVHNLFCFLCWICSHDHMKYFKSGVCWYGIDHRQFKLASALLHILGSQSVLCKCPLGIRFLKELCTQYMEVVLLFIFYKAHIQCNALVSKEQNLLESLHCKYCLTCLVSLSLSLDFPTWPRADWANNGNIFVSQDSCTEQSNRSWSFGPNTDWAIQVFLLPEVLQETSLAALARFIFAVNPRCPFPHG